MNRLVLQTCLVVENVSFVEVSSVLNMLACVSMYFWFCGNYGLVKNSSRREFWSCTSFGSYLSLDVSYRFIYLVNLI